MAVAATGGNSLGYYSFSSPSNPLEAAIELSISHDTFDEVVCALTSSKSKLKGMKFPLESEKKYAWTMGMMEAGLAFKNARTDLGQRIDHFVSLFYAGSIERCKKNVRRLFEEALYGDIPPLFSEITRLELLVTQEKHEEILSSVEPLLITFEKAIYLSAKFDHSESQDRLVANFLQLISMKAHCFSSQGMQEEVKKIIETALAKVITFKNEQNRFAFDKASFYLELLQLESGRIVTSQLSVSANLLFRAVEQRLDMKFLPIQAPEDDSTEALIKAGLFEEVVDREMGESELKRAALILLERYEEAEEDLVYTDQLENPDLPTFLALCKEDDATARKLALENGDIWTLLALQIIAKERDEMIEYLSSSEPSILE